DTAALAVYVCTACFVAFICSRDLRHLHSFPTRRSSDLDVHLRLWRRAVHQPAPLDHAVDAEHPADRRNHVGLHHQQQEEAGGEQDRKSTRLNSSHVKSSYAVFCLKKKKQELISRDLISI